MNVVQQLADKARVPKLLRGKVELRESVTRGGQVARRSCLGSSLSCTVAGESLVILASSILRGKVEMRALQNLHNSLERRRHPSCLSALRWPRRSPPRRGEPASCFCGRLRELQFAVCTLLRNWSTFSTFWRFQRFDLFEWVWRWSVIEKKRMSVIEPTL